MATMADGGRANCVQMEKLPGSKEMTALMIVVSVRTVSLFCQLSRSAAKLRKKFSAMSVLHCVHRERGSHVTIIYDALNLTVQDNQPQSHPDMRSHCRGTHSSVPAPTYCPRQNSKSVQTCSW